MPKAPKCRTSPPHLRLATAGRPPVSQKAARDWWSGVPGYHSLGVAGAPKPPAAPERHAMSFRDNLQHLRATRNMTQEQLAMLLGVSRQSVTKWEAEKSYPEMDKLIKICRLFDCTLDDLVTGDLTQRPSEEPSVPGGPAARRPTSAATTSMHGTLRRASLPAPRSASCLSCQPSSWAGRSTSRLAF